MSNLEKTEYEYLMSRIKHISTIKENEKTQISLVYYEGNGGTAILRVCKDRNLSELCQMLMQVRNPNISVVYDYAFWGGDTYILEEYLAGNTLWELFEEQGVFSEKETIRIIVNVCNGLKELHSKMPPIVHNDIKMENIMVRDDGGIKLFDFDAARTYKAGKDKNTRLLGTEEYAAPEHRGYGQSEPRTDIYSLGVTMHYMLTGYGLNNNHKVTYKGPLKSVIEKCVEIDYKKRYFSVQHLAKDLEKKMHSGRRVLKFLAISGLAVSILCLVLVLSSFLALGLNSSDSEKSINEEERTETIRKENEVADRDENQELLEQKHMEETVPMKEVAEEDMIESKPNEMLSVGEKSVQEGENPDIPTQEKKMEIVGKVDGTLWSMVALNDGTILTLEYNDGKYVIRSSVGEMFTVLEDMDFSFGTKLIYNNFSGDLYLLGFRAREMLVYNVSEKMEIMEVAQIDYDHNAYISDFGDMSCTFFSDGTLYCNYIHKFIDTRNWVVLGDAPAGGAGVINDRMYARGSLSFFEEIDESGSVIKTFSNNGFSGSGENREIYYDGKYAYFIGWGEDEKSYLYRFDGEVYTSVICLDDYKYYTEFRLNHLCVTESIMRCYDVTEKVIKEFVMK